METEEREGTMSAPKLQADEAIIQAMDAVFAVSVLCILLEEMRKI